MKRVTINANHLGVIMKNGAVDRVLTTGKHWIGFGSQVETYDFAQSFYTKHNVDVLLQSEVLRPYLTVIEVADHELILVFANTNFKEVLRAGKHVFWNGLVSYTFKRIDLNEIHIDASIDRSLFEKPALAFYIRQYKVEPNEKGLLYIDGKLEAELAAGTYYWLKNATNISVIKADIRQMNIEVTGQEILTKDKAQLRINFSAQYQIVDVLKALHENKDFERQLYVILQLALRTFVGRMTLDELMENKTEINQAVASEVRDNCKYLGLEINYCGVKDIILPGDIKDIMNQVLIAEKRAQANIIMRREETASTRSLLNTARLMEENTMLFKLKEMEYVEKIAEKINSISVSGNGQIIDQLKNLFVK
ncbi:slipin family protein [Sphingobacterium spiritivorum]|uniref:slipin family protein n=1 Tax=Sphingobacterium spiritivorum TaxID=258 RepID=UPI003DA25B2C